MRNLHNIILMCLAIAPTLALIKAPNQSLWPRSELDSAVTTPSSQKSTIRNRQNHDETSLHIQSLQDEVVYLVNIERQAYGCPTLTIAFPLAYISQVHSEDMAARGYFAHDTPEGASPQDRGDAVGYGGGVGENIALGPDSSVEVVEVWMASDSHRANILGCDYRETGVGVAPSSSGGYYWTQDFGLPW